MIWEIYTVLQPDGVRLRRVRFERIAYKCMSTVVRSFVVNVSICVVCAIMYIYFFVLFQ